MSTYRGVNVRLAWCLKCDSPSRGLLRDCKTSRNLREPSFEALIVAGVPRPCLSVP